MTFEKALARALAGTGTPVDFTGTWVNELGSKARITSHVGATLDGEYESKVSTTGGTTIGDLRGYADGDLVSWVVHWRDFQAITSWVGQLEPATSRLKTLWQMTKQVTEGEEWASINAGSDSFERA